MAKKIKLSKIKDPTYEICLEAVKSRPYNLAYVPKNFLDEEMCLTYLKHVGIRNFHDIKKIIPEMIINESFILKAYNLRKELFFLVPDSLKTYDMCVEAVDKYIVNFLYVPKEFITEELCLNFFKNYDPYNDDYNFNYDLNLLKIKKHIPDQIFTNDFILKIINLNLDLLSIVPDCLKTVSMCVDAVKHNQYNIEDVPEKLMTDEFWKACLESFDSNPLIIQYLPEKYLTPELCHSAVCEMACLLFEIPENFWTEDLVELCVDQNCNLNCSCDFSCFEDIPDKWKTTRVCEIYFFNAYPCYNRLDQIPLEKRTQEMYLAAFAHNTISFFDIPKEFLTREICIKELVNKRIMLSDIPTEMLDDEICRKGVIANIYNIEYVPDSLKTETFWRICYEHNHKISQYIPQKFKI